MKTHLAALMLTATALGNTAAASAAPAPAPAPANIDPRVQTIDYDPMRVVQISGVSRTATEIVLGADETILHVALGDATAWDVAVEKNILFLKPKVAHGSTNLIVTTDRRGVQTRTYSFELKVIARRKAQQIYILRFQYPQDLKADALASLSDAEKRLRAKLTELQLERGAVEGPRNLAYSVQGAKALEPSEISDNGRFTVLRFPGSQAIPSVYEVQSDGTESLTPFDVRGEYLVIHGTAAQFRLRRGSEVLCLYNEKPDPYGVNLGTHTSSSKVERTDHSKKVVDDVTEKEPSS